MSFSHKIKNEILSLPVNSINSAKAEIFGIFITGENTNNFESCIRCENDFVIKRMENIFLSLYAVIVLSMMILVYLRRSSLASDTCHLRMPFRQFTL